MQGVKTYQTLKGTRVTIFEKSFNEGAEGNVHKIAEGNGKDTHCVKLFKHNNANTPNERLKKKEREKRIIYMIDHPPKGYLTNRFKICWPVDGLVQNNELIGFVMPFSGNSIQLYHLCKIGNVNHSVSYDYTQYSRNTLNGSRARLQLCNNIAAAIYRLHIHGLYTIVDLKPSNVLVTPDGKVSIIDCDSIQITSNGKTLFKSSMCTPEYIPPEYKLYQDKLVDRSWDFFAMAVIFYQVLFGIHPYTSTFSGEYEGVTMQERISNALFVHGEKASKYLLQLAPPHKNFMATPRPLQMLFKRAFESDRFHFKNRPSTSDWGKLFHYYSREPFILEREPPIRKTKTINYKKKAPVVNTKSTKDNSWVKVCISFLIWIVLIAGLLVLLN